MKTHKVIDLIYLPEEGQDTFVGTLKECVDFVEQQGSMLLEVVPLTKEEIEIINSVY